MVQGAARTGGRRIDGHIVRGVVQELGARVALDVVAVVVAPAQLHVHPVPVQQGASVNNAIPTYKQQADMRMRSSCYMPSTHPSQLEGAKFCKRVKCTADSQEKENSVNPHSI